jgi:hypothetical protein
VIPSQTSGRTGVRRFAPLNDGVLLAIVLVAAALRAWGLGRQSYWFDEWSTTTAVSRRLPGLLTYLSRREGSPPGYFVTAWIWVRIFGDGEAAVRALSVLAGVAVLPVAYSTVLALGGSRTSARLAAGMLALHPLLIWYSQEARPYSLVVLASAVSLLGFSRAWTQGRNTDIWLWALTSAVAVGIHYFAMFPALMTGAFLLIGRADRRRTTLAASAVGGALVVCLTPLVLDQRDYSQNQSWIRDFSVAERLSEALRSFLVGPNAPHARLWVLVAVLLMAAAVLARRPVRRLESPVLVMAAVGVGSVVLPLATLVIGVDLFIGRYVIVAAVPLVVAVALWLGESQVSALRAIALAVAVVWAFGVAHVDRTPAQQRPDWRGAAEAFTEPAPGGTGGARVLVLNTGALAAPLEHYLPSRVVRMNETEAVTVDRIDVVTLLPSSAPCNLLIGSACGLIFLGGPVPDALDRRLVPTGRSPVAPMVVEHLRPADGSSIRVRKADLVEPWELAGSLVLYDPGSEPPD